MSANVTRMKAHSSVTQLLDTLKTVWRSITPCSYPALTLELVKMMNEDAETVFARAMQHAQDIRRSELIREKWELRGVA